MIPAIRTPSSSPLYHVITDSPNDHVLTISASQIGDSRPLNFAPSIISNTYGNIVQADLISDCKVNPMNIVNGCFQKLAFQNQYSSDQLSQFNHIPIANNNQIHNVNNIQNGISNSSTNNTEVLSSNNYHDNNANCSSDCNSGNHITSVQKCGKQKIKNKFTPEEDEKLKQLVSMYGTNSWPIIASLMGGRNHRQCRERWKNYVNPDLRNSEPWTYEEDYLLEKNTQNLGRNGTKSPNSLQADLIMQLEIDGSSSFDNGSDKTKTKLKQMMSTKMHFIVGEVSI
ncbi:hypothetical protein TRFO_17703 [Tritrichomonas foetus]|uniref:Uncharacterized protein n=1 Tax=Tritrichomonas foetus TaxID=1144522 RepID=A0A1J4KMI3_9EUKA|nr:hypothetical protein TRFO_17703 [Tritrichomonas foetus]|eukprot:OHT12435.1 hypothetical protein TRFO_17703 [Tritrichomonas foetus]